MQSPIGLGAAREPRQERGGGRLQPPLGHDGQQRRRIGRHREGDARLRGRPVRHEPAHAGPAPAAILRAADAHRHPGMLCSAVARFQPSDLDLLLRTMGSNTE